MTVALLEFFQRIEVPTQRSLNKESLRATFNLTGTWEITQVFFVQDMQIIANFPRFELRKSLSG